VETLFNNKQRANASAVKYLHSTTGTQMESQDPRMREVALGGTKQAIPRPVDWCSYTFCSKETTNIAKRHECTNVL